MTSMVELASTEQAKTWHNHSLPPHELKEAKLPPLDSDYTMDDNDPMRISGLLFTNRARVLAEEKERRDREAAEAAERERKQEMMDRGLTESKPAL